MQRRALKKFNFLRKKQHQRSSLTSQKHDFPIQSRLLLSRHDSTKKGTQSHLHVFRGPSLKATLNPPKTSPVHTRVTRMIRGAARLPARRKFGTQHEEHGKTRPDKLPFLAAKGFEPVNGPPKISARKLKNIVRPAKRSEKPESRSKQRVGVQPLHAKEHHASRSQRRNRPRLRNRSQVRDRDGAPHPEAMSFLWASGA